jgi:hypothetical protein
MALMTFFTCQIDDGDLLLQEAETLDDIVRNALRDRGIEPASFSWCIKVEYAKEEDEE